MRGPLASLARRMLLGAAAMSVCGCAQVLGIQDLDLLPADASQTDTNSSEAAGSDDASDGSKDSSKDQSVEVEAGSDVLLDASAEDHKDVLVDPSSEVIAETGLEGGADADVTEVTCLLGTKLCGDQCVSTSQVATGCSEPSCAPCVYEHAEALCEGAGKCAAGKCVNGYQDCDSDWGNGCETAIKTDENNCGACGTICGLTHANVECVGGSCILSGCEAGWKNCDGDDTNGCEVETDKDLSNCGACGLSCSFPNAQAHCVLGVCQKGSCDSDYLDCDGLATNGCEVFCKTNSQHCGACNASCTPDAGETLTCKNSQCVFTTCLPPAADCDNDPGDCEANLTTNANNCGSCGVVCNLPNAAAICSGGQCAIETCATGFGDCDSDPSNGCETDLSTNTSRCGGCSTVCPAGANSIPICVEGVCGAVCAAGYGDCDATPGNGCETVLSSSPLHCGECGNACSDLHGTRSCQAGVCTIACATNWGDCVAAEPGCETDLQTSLNHCGACGTVCTGISGTASCQTGQCSIECIAGFGDCNSNAADGCEVSLNSMVTHCGKCGRACSSQQVALLSCLAGVCNSTCNLGYANCSKPTGSSADDGCEKAVALNNTDCGGCDNDCTQQGKGFVCGGGARPANLCGCDSDAKCNPESTSAGTCSSEGLCVCKNKTCERGEHCIHPNNKDICSCNGGAACNAGQVCCQTPAGCKNVESDPQNCGACGHACPSGFSCSSGQCVP